MIFFESVHTRIQKQDQGSERKTDPSQCSPSTIRSACWVNFDIPPREELLGQNDTANPLRLVAADVDRTQHPRAVQNS